MAKRGKGAKKHRKFRIILLLFCIVILVIYFNITQSAKDRFDEAYEIFVNSELIISEWKNQRCPEMLGNSIISIIHIDKSNYYISCWRGMRYDEVERSPAKFGNCSKEDMKNIDDAVRIRYSCQFPLDKIVPDKLTDYYAVIAGCYIANKPGINYTDIYIPCYGYALPHSILYAVVDLRSQKIYY